MPVPLSPVISSVVAVSASFSAISRTRSDAGSAATHTMFARAHASVVSPSDSSRGFAGRSDAGKSSALGGAPEPFEIVELPRAVAEDVHDETAVIEQHPFRADLPFAMRQAHVLASQLLFDGIADGLELRRALAGAEQKIFGERAGKLQDRDVHGLLFLRRLDGPENFGTKVFDVSPVQGLSENVFLHARGHKSVDALLPFSRSRTSVDERGSRLWSANGSRFCAARFCARPALACGRVFRAESPAAAHPVEIPGGWR